MRHEFCEGLLTFVNHDFGRDIQLELVGEVAEKVILAVEAMRNLGRQHPLLGGPVLVHGIEASLHHC